MNRFLNATLPADVMKMLDESYGDTMLATEPSVVRRLSTAAKLRGINP